LDSSSGVIADWWQCIDDVGQPVMESCRHRVDLDPVAGAQQQRFRDVLTVEQLVQDLACVRAGHRDPL
jgi:hypothetical protein